MYYSDQSGQKMSNQASISSREPSPEPRRNRIFDNGGKVERTEDCLEIAPPALPPRPNSRPPHQSRTRTSSRNNCNCEFSLNADPPNTHNRSPRSCWSSGLRKYVFLCTLCGTLSILLGSLFLTVYFMLKSYTSSLNYFETVPTYIPAAMLMTTGFLISCLACRKNRNSFLMKLCGACSLSCALLCLSVTVTTAVIHMNRLQTLRECYYTAKTRSCTCESIISDGDTTTDDAVKFVFNSTSDCEVIHGVLYSCLRAVFGLSVVGILICIFTCMLVYQLLSHEKKKMYWAQLEMRCRYLYGQHGQQPFCSCCDECRYPAPTPHEMFPWDLMGNRFLTPGRIGNLYTPNPEDRNEQSRPGWSWRRLPWGRTTAPLNTNHAAHRVRPDISSPDSQYGFTSGTNGETTVEGAPYTVIDSRVQTLHPDCPSALPDDITEGGFYSWGPPPPYFSNPNSATNSPARRSLGGLLSHISPIGRHSVSPARIPHPRLLRQHLSDRPPAIQVSAPPKSNPHNPRMTGPSRQSVITSAMQMQLASSSSNRSNSMTSVSHSDADPKQDNYENTSEIERMCQNRTINSSSVSGFNTLPSLKKRHQPELTDLFPKKVSNESGASAENIAPVDLKSDEGLPPRVYMESSHGSDGSRVANDASSVGSQSQNSSNTGNRYSKDNNSPKQLEDTENKTPHGNNHEIYQNEHFIKKKVVRKLDYNVNQNKGDPLRGRQGGDKSQFPKNAVRRPIPKPPRNTSATPEHSDPRKSEKVMQKIKISSNDPDLIQKHGSLMKEFNINISRQIKKNQEHENTNNSFGFNGFENYGFQHLEKELTVPKPNYRRPVPGNDMEISLVGYHSKKGVPESRKCEDGPVKDARVVECESDVYFGDISNSSCYMSLRSEVPDSLYEEAVEPKKDQHNGKPLLNKINLKLIEKESCKLDAKNLEYNEVLANPSPSSLESTASGSSSGCKRMRDGSEHSLESFCSNRSGTFPSFSLEDRESADSAGKMSDIFVRPSLELKRQNFSQCSHYPGNEIGGKRGASSHANAHQLPNQFRPVREPCHPIHHSNDEQSSSSLTADSGISSGRNYLPRGYYCEKSQLESLSNDSESSLELAKTPSSTESGTAPLSEFTAALFQKPKVHPRGNRCREPEEPEIHHEIQMDDKVKTTQNYTKKVKKYYAGSPQSSEGATPSGEDNHPPNPKPRGPGKVGVSSPKPLPRTTISKTRRSSPSDCDGRHSLEATTTYKSLAPDAQYDFTEAKSVKPKSSRMAIGSPRSKPTIPARPLNLPPKPSENNDRLLSNLVTPPRRRPRGEPSELGTAIDYHPTASHSVNV